MANSKIVSYGEIESAASQLGAGREEITSKLTNIQAEIGSLVSSGYVTDQASAKFNEAYNRYTQSANSLIAHLSEIQSFLTQTANAMRDMGAPIASRDI
ncbi:WXG100 family type VII secretion target [Leucobacter luti]|uniref:WXG100 family type VII secretion target n=1 Tax=Leucobacter luti TaxID=340320 RepID=A0A4R6RYT7_9MICO|nr:WXG100 family type VII secretion target [Leucobacter luti]TDP92329.1 WXG100 family type VII secretion target [Leucobacter luti]